MCESNPKVMTCSSEMIKIEYNIRTNIKNSKVMTCSKDKIRQINIVGMKSDVKIHKISTKSGVGN